MASRFNENINAFVTPPSLGANVRLPLSSSLNGNPIHVIKTGTGTTSVHTAQENVLEELYIWATNYGADDVVLTMSAGPMSSGSNVVKTPLGASKGMYLVWPGIPLKGETLYAEASLANTVNLLGFAVRYYPKNPSKTSQGFFGPYS